MPGKRQKAIEAGHLTYSGTPCRTCGNTTKRVDNQLCYICHDTTPSRRADARAAGQAVYTRATPCPTCQGHAFDVERNVCVYCSERTPAEPSNRQKAQAKGEMFYQGVPCPYGHDGTRYASKGQCYQCQIDLSRSMPRGTQAESDRQRTWKAANPARRLAQNVKSHTKARQLGASTDDLSINADSLADLMADQGGCAYCGATDDMELDHKTPLSRGGAHSLDNVQWLCSVHNQHKRAMTDVEYRDAQLIADVTPWDRL